MIHIDSVTRLLKSQVMQNSFKSLLVSFARSASVVSIFMSPITGKESYSEKLLSSI